MTVIVGLFDFDSRNLWLGGDSAGVSGLHISTRADQKVFQNGEFIFGISGSFRMGNLLRYKFNAPKQMMGVSDHKYMCTDFIDALRDCFGKNGFGYTNEHTPNTGGTFLVGYNQTLYLIDSDYQVGVNANGYAAIGCGDTYALGSLHSTASSDMTPSERVKAALEASNAFSGGVTPPYTIICQEAPKVDKTGAKEHQVTVKKPRAKITKSKKK